MRYQLLLKDQAKEKQIIDEVRVRNGNLPVVLGKLTANRDELYKEEPFMKLIYPLLLSSLLLGACGQTDSTSTSSSSSSAGLRSGSAAVTNVSTTLDDSVDYYGSYEEEDVDASYDEATCYAT